MLERSAQIAVFALGVSGCTRPSSAASQAQPVAAQASSGSRYAGYSCQPESLGMWRAHWRPPIQPIAGACTEAQIEAHFEACDGPKSSAEACRSLKVLENRTCLECLISDPADAHYGALIFDENYHALLANQAGCIALVDGDLGPTGCGAKRQVASSCIQAACASVCSVNQSRIAWETCQQRAALTLCREYVAVANCYRPEYAKCFHHSFKDYFVETAKQFCTTGL